MAPAPDVRPHGGSDAGAGATPPVRVSIAPSSSSGGILVDAALPTERTALLRRPFHYPPDQDEGVVPNSVPATTNERAIYCRYKYYARLDNAIGVIPEHVVPAPFFAALTGVPLPAGGETVKQSSFITIFSIWTTMMGTSMLSMPWAIHSAGLVLGVFLVLFLTFICMYTAWRVITLQRDTLMSGPLLELPALNGAILGKWAELTTVVFSTLSLLGAAIVYYVLLSNFLYHTGTYIQMEIVNGTDQGANFSNAVRTSFSSVVCPNFTFSPPRSQLKLMLTAEGDDEESSTFDEFWSLNLTVPLILIPVLSPFLNFQSPTFFTKFTSLGTFSVIYIFIFIFIRIAKWGFLNNVNFTNPSDPHYVSLARFKSAHILSGVLALALFIHNAIITIISHQENPRNNTRDLIIAYILVASTYLGVGLLFFLGFPLDKDCIEDNFLNNFSPDDVLAMVARIFLFFQLATVFPLILYVIRAQLFFAISGVVWPSLFRVVLLNALILTLCVLFAIFLPHIGAIIRFSGALCGLVLVFLMPPLCCLKLARQSGTGTWYKTMFHAAIIVVGVANFGLQFM